MYLDTVLGGFQVNEMRDNATQMEDEIDRIQQSISQGRMELTQLKSEVQAMDTRNPGFVSTNFLLLLSS